MTVDVAAQQRRAEAEAELATNSMYELLGSHSGLQALVNRFYEIMDADPSFQTIRDMHQADLASMRLNLFEFLSGWFGGPPLYVERHGSPCLTEAHAPFKIDQEARDQWLACMSRAMVEVGVPEKYRDLLVPAFAGMADSMRNDHARA